MTSPPPAPKGPGSQGTLGPRDGPKGTGLEAQRAKRAFLAHMRHELRTPINAIMGYSELLIEDAGDRGHQDFIADLERIHAAGKQVLALVNSILDQSKIEASHDIDILRFEAEVRHGLRTPVAAVVGYAEMLIEDAGEAHGDDLVPDLVRIRDAAGRLLSLIDDVLSLWQVQAGKTELDQGVAGSYQMVQEALTSMAPSALDRNRAASVAGGSLLVVDDNETNRDLLCRNLRREGHKVSEAPDGRQALNALGAGGFDLVLLDILMPEMNGYEVLIRLKADDVLRHIPVIVLSALDDMDSVVRCIELGADDYLPKPVNPVLLKARIDSCLEKKRNRDQELAYLEQLRIEREHSLRELLEVQRSGPAQIPGTTRLAAQLRSEAKAAAANNKPLLILGEPGSEKPMVAQIVHEKGKGSSGPFLCLNCADISPMALEKEAKAGSFALEMAQMSALFGHQSGAFSFARTNRAGYLELAAGGTLVLENVERLTKAVQERLLAYLQTGKVCRLGGSREVSTDVRTVATSHPGLSKDAEHGAFDAGLYEQLSAQVISVPPLRERKRDLMVWAEYFIGVYRERLGKEVTGITKEAMNLILAYDWPNNADELESVIQRGVRLADGPMLTPEQIFIGLAPIEPRNKLDLLRLPFLRRALESPLYPGLLQLFSVAFFVFILLSGLVGPRQADSNLSLLLAWAWWWPLLIVGILFTGRFFCSVCPMGAVGRFVQRHFSLKLKVPPQLKKYGLYVAAAGFLAIIWVEQATDMDQSPMLTALLMLTIMCGAVAASLLFERAAWCRFLCPLGRMIGAYSTLSAVEVRTNPSVCKAECKTHGCYTGTERAAGCPMYEGAFALQSNEACKLCGDCLKNCTNKAIRLNLRLPGSEAWDVPQHSFALAVLVPILMATVLGIHLRSSDLYQRWLGDSGLEWLALLGVTLLIAITLWGAMALVTYMARERPAGGLAWLPYAFLPLALAGEMGHQAEPLLSQAGSVLAVAARQFNLGYGQYATIEAASATAATRVLLLIAGCAASMYLGHRLLRRYRASSGALARLPLLLLVGALGLAYGVLFVAG